jgi:hypothetical protein
MERLSASEIEAMKLLILTLWLPLGWWSAASGVETSGLSATRMVAIGNGGHDVEYDVEEGDPPPGPAVASSSTGHDVEYEVEPSDPGGN